MRQLSSARKSASAKNHAQIKRWSEMTIRRKVIALQACGLNHARLGSQCQTGRSEMSRIVDISRPCASTYSGEGASYRHEYPADILSERIKLCEMFKYVSNSLVDLALAR